MRAASRLKKPVIGVAIVLLGCSIDERALLLGIPRGGEAGIASSPEPGGTGLGAAPSGGDGAAGSPPSDSVLHGCADLDTDGILDCEATLLTSPTFSTDVNGWTAVEPATLAWDASNALSERPSGSAKLSAALGPARAFQCAPLAGEQLVIVYASARVANDENSAGSTNALLEVSFFEDGACEGERQRYFETPPAVDANTWITVHAGGLAMTETRSVALALVVANPNAPTPVHGYFDNVMLKARAP